MKIPNGERAFVDMRKIRGYCLSVVHPRGQHKARVFKSSLGWTIDNVDEVRNRLLRVVQTDEAVFLGSDEYGQRYALDFPIHGSGGVTAVRSLWIIRPGEDFPRLTTFYVL